MIVSIEGPNLAGKTTKIRELESLLDRERVPHSIIPEYVDYLVDQNRQPERPLISTEQMEQEGRFYIELERVRQRDTADAIDNYGLSHLILTDRTFFTCLAYSRISGNPISEKMFQNYVDSGEFIFPDRIFFLCIDPESGEYERRKMERKRRNPMCRGLSYKVKEYEYIYRNRDYERYFRENVAKKFGNITFLDSLKTSAENLYDLIQKGVG
jgi:thymidylate kinase